MAFLRVYVTCSEMVILWFLYCDIYRYHKRLQCISQYGFYTISPIPSPRSQTTPPFLLARCSSKRTNTQGLFHRPVVHVSHTHTHTHAGGVCMCGGGHDNHGCLPAGPLLLSSGWPRAPTYKHTPNTAVAKGYGPSRCSGTFNLWKCLVNYLYRLE